MVDIEAAIKQKPTGFRLPSSILYFSINKISKMGGKVRVGNSQKEVMHHTRHDPAVKLLHAGTFLEVLSACLVSQAQRLLSLQARLDSQKDVIY